MTNGENLDRRSRGFGIKRKKRAKNAVLLMIKRLIEGPGYPRDFQRELSLSRSTVKYHLRRLLQYGIAKRLRDRRYAFINYVDGEELIIEAVKQWKSLALRPPLIEEVASEVGIVPDEARSLVYKTKDKTGWFMCNQGIIESATEKLGEVLVCASRMRGEKPSDWKEMYSGDAEILREAKRFLKESPEMLPKLSENGMQVISWPPEALKYLGKEHQPKERSTPSRLAAFTFG